MADKKVAKVEKPVVAAAAGVAKVVTPVVAAAAEVAKVVTPVDPNIAAKNYAAKTANWPAFVDATGELLTGDKSEKKAFVGKVGKIAFCDYQILRYQAKKSELIAGKPVSTDKLIEKITKETARLAELQSRLAALQGNKATTATARLSKQLQRLAANKAPTA